MTEPLPPARAALARRTLAWCDAFWDDRRALAWAPSGAGFGRVHLVPQSAWYAYGLLARGEGDDRRRAARALEALLDLQYDEPGSAWHGSFARPRPPIHPKMPSSGGTTIPTGGSSSAPPSWRCSRTSRRSSTLGSWVGSITPCD